MTKQKKSGIQQRGIAIWFTGLSGAGKSTLSEALQTRLLEEGYHTKLLDGDFLRNGINKDLGFTDEDRLENIRRAAEIAKLFVENNTVTLCSFITPSEKMRSIARSIIGPSNYLEIFVKCSLVECEKRDLKGLYKKARAGSILNFTGLTSSFEEPQQSDFIIDTEAKSINACLKEIYNFIKAEISA